MVNGEERQLQAIGDANLVVNVAQVVLDDLLGGAEMVGNLFILVALDDVGNDAQIVFDGQHLGGAGAKDRLSVGQYDLDHGVLLFPHELVSVNHAGHTVGRAAAGRCCSAGGDINAHHAAATLDINIFLGA